MTWEEELKQKQELRIKQASSRKGRAGAIQAGIRMEQKRIIKLLESYFKPEEAKSIYPANYEQYLDLIALIKGEQK